MSDPTFLIGTATTEPASGSENQIPYNGADGGYQTTAVLDGDNYIVNGKKHFISNVGWARLMFTFVRTIPTWASSRELLSSWCRWTRPASAWARRTTRWATV